MASGGAYGCAAAKLPDPLAEAFAAREVARARDLAPDLYGRAEQARREAASSSEPELREHARARAELWLQAALVEARRIEQQRAASDAETRVVRAEAARVAALDERAQLERELTRVESERASKRLASNMLHGGALAEAAKGGSEAVLAEAESFAIGRATALLAAARALGLPADRVAALDARLAAHGVAPPSPARVRASIELLAACERALGQARLSRPSPSESERASLGADAAERGLSLELSAEGAVVALDASAFAPGRAVPSSEGARALVQIASLLRLHARGAVLVESAGSRLDQGRARAVASRLRAERSDLRVAGVATPGAASVRVVLRAYGKPNDSGAAAAPAP